MTIDEAIQYAKDLGTEEENKIDYDKDSPHTIIRKKNTVKDYRQLAEWLRELKELRKLTVINPIIAGYNEVYEKLRKGDIEASNDKDLLKTAVDTLENVMPKYRRLSEENQKQKEQIAECKRLLKAAVEALNDGSCNKDCRQCENCKSCDYDDRFKWKHTDEALKLIEEEEK